MIYFIPNVLGFMLLWAAVIYRRTPESEIKFFSKEWWVVLLLITVGTILTGLK